VTPVVIAFRPTGGARGTTGAGAAVDGGTAVVGSSGGGVGL